MTTFDDIAVHFAGSTGAMRQELAGIETRLQIALKTQRTEIGLRREIVDILGIVQRALAEQRQRDVKAGNVPTPLDADNDNPGEPLDPMRGVEFPFAENH